MTERWITGALLLILFFSLAACGAPAVTTPEQAVQTWLNAWTQMDLDSLLKLASPGYQAQVKSFYGHEFVMYSKVSFKDLTITKVSEANNEAKVQADFQVELESPSSMPSVAGMVISSTVRQVFSLVKGESGWLIDGIDRQPL
jgi:hypothetical protein